MRTCNFLFAILFLATLIAAQQKCTVNIQEFKPNEVQQILAAHNHYRSLLARGLYEGFPAATNMKLMRWDRSLATLAKTWVSTCQPTSSPEGFRTLEPWGVLGENIFLSNLKSISDFYNFNYSRAVDSWMEKSLYIDRTGISYYKPNVNAREFTQMIWATTTRVGCSSAVFYKEGRNRRFIVCYYASKGDTPGEPVYISGTEAEACSRCGARTCSTRYPGVCDCYFNKTRDCLMFYEAQLEGATHELDISTEKNLVTFSHGRLKRKITVDRRGDLPPGVYKVVRVDDDRYGQVDVITLVDSEKLISQRYALKENESDTVGYANVLRIPGEFRVQIFPGDTILVTKSMR